MSLLLITFILPLIASVATFALGNKMAKVLALLFSAATFVLSIGVYLSVAHSETGSLQFAVNWIPEMNIHFSLLVDGLSIWLLLLTNFLVPVILLASYQKSFKNEAALYALVLLMQFGLVGVFTAADGFLFYIFWELALLPIYFIVWLWNENPDEQVRTRTAFKFFIYTIAGSLFMLLGFMYLYVKLGSLDLSTLYSSSLDSKDQIILFAFFFAAFAIKIPIFPFHTWQADTYRESPTIGTMLLSGIMLKMGIYGLIRWLIPVLPLGTAFWTPYIIALCVIGVIYGAIIAIRQDNLKSLLAYSSLSHVGLIAAGTLVLTNEGFQGASIQMLAHGVNVVGAFFIAEIILQRTGTLSISQLGGIRLVAPKFFTCAVIMVLASVALPLTNGFVGEFLLLFSMFQYNTWLAVLAGTTIVLGAVYMLWMTQRVFLGNVNSRTEKFEDLKTTELVVFVVLIACVFIFGVYPKLVFDLLQTASGTILGASLR